MTTETPPADAPDTGSTASDTGSTASDTGSTAPDAGAEAAPTRWTKGRKLLVAILIIGVLDAIGLDWRLVESEIDALKAVTPEQVRTVAQRYLVDDNLTVATLDPLPMDLKQTRVAPVVGGRHGS